MTTCTLKEIRFKYPHPHERLFVVVRQGGERAAVGDKILAWTELVDMIVPDRLKAHLKRLPGSETDPDAPFGSVFS